MISVVVPTYNEETNLEELHRRLSDVAGEIRQHEFEFIFVDDHSTDKTPEILKKLNETDHRLKVIRFARNCGSHAAMRAGLTYCRGDYAVVLAADLQDPPEIIHDMLKEAEKGAKIVWGIRASREGERASTKTFSQFYYKLINWLTVVKMAPLGTDVFMAHRVVLEAFKRMPEKHTSVFMALAWLGFPQGSFEYVKKARQHGETKWTVGKKIKLMLDSILAFSDIPIRYMSILGFITAFFGFCYAFFVAFQYFFHGVPVEGWSSLIVAILIVGGVQMSMLGVLGEYLWRTFDESRRRPQFVMEYLLDSNEQQKDNF
ncbi:MAG: glycosyltransferase family 2 protein, partial [Candidatus Omnitrophica bacterium]|nr:glycosyltransferase family 2 protein [Candidatus Omnitrophota bacterium]